MFFGEIYCIAGITILAIMTGLWLLSLALRDASIVDIFWGLGFVICAWIFAALTPQGAIPRKTLLLALVSAWGLRLALHIWLRNRGKGEDYRYQNWRRQHGRRWWWQSFFQVFLLQGILLWLISTPLLAAQLPEQPAQLGWLDGLGALVWTVGFYFEAAGDWQLARFKSDPANRGKLFNAGVWRYTRHPNYFGDAAQWWGYYLLAASAGGWWTIYSPLLMTWLLLKVSGVALLERSLEDSKPGYQEYVRTTSAFLPWFPKK
jgi:steroid 5-alpha reductase family enzyme